MGQLRQPFISKWERDSYFKVGQCLFESGTIISKWGKNYFKVGQLRQSGAKSYFKVGQLLQNGSIISKWGIIFGHNVKLLQVNWYLIPSIRNIVAPRVAKQHKTEEKIRIGWR